METSQVGNTVIRDIDALRCWREAQRGSIGLVMTMGCLHAGHAALLKQSISENDLTVLTIYTNPTQFDQIQDFTTYPKTLDADVRLARQLGVDVVFVPSDQDMYPDQYRYQIHEKQLSDQMEGKCRPGHFNGMLTIVGKMMVLVRADRAYFGEKDYQQLLLIQGMVTALLINTQVIAVPTVREESQLALSSRNTRLTEQQKALAPKFPEILLSAQSVEEAHKALEVAGFKVDYVEEYQGRRFGAVFLGEVRLIDNIVRENIQTC